MATDPERPEPRSRLPHVALVATVSEHPDRPDECTVFPHRVSNRDERRSAWVTARGDAFVELSSCR